MTLQDYGECWNPTEAGGRSDGIGMETKSILTEIYAGGNVLNTTSHPAYWVRGNDTQAGDSGAFCPAGTPSYNSEDTHPYDFKKLVTLGCFSLDNCIQIDMTAELGNSPDMPPFTGFAKLEAPAAYLNSDFVKVSYLDPDTGYLENIEDVTNDEIEQLVIIHSEDEHYALGAVTKPRPPTSSGTAGLHYLYKDYGSGQFDRSTYKWSVVIREDLKAGDVFTVSSYLCVGSLNMVVECLVNVQDQLFK